MRSHCLLQEFDSPLVAVFYPPLSCGQTTAVLYSPLRGGQGGPVLPLLPLGFHNEAPLFCLPVVPPQPGRALCKLQQPPLRELLP